MPAADGPDTSASGIRIGVMPRITRRRWPASRYGTDFSPLHHWNHRSGASVFSSEPDSGELRNRDLSGVQRTSLASQRCRGSGTATGSPAGRTFDHLGFDSRGSHSLPRCARYQAAHCIWVSHCSVGRVPVVFDPKEANSPPPPKQAFSRSKLLGVQRDRSPEFAIASHSGSWCRPMARSPLARFSSRAADKSTFSMTRVLAAITVRDGPVTQQIEMVRKGSSAPLTALTLIAERLLPICGSISISGNCTVSVLTPGMPSTFLAGIGPAFA